MRRGPELAIAAATLVGTRFRLHGRDPATGLDCVGLVSVSLTLIGKRPLSISGYALRNGDVAHWFAEAERVGLHPAEGKIESGDVLLVSPSSLQHHLMISENPAQMIHAHAALRRVVREPMPQVAPLAHWRL
ncbi:MAG: NlpC/P60 family protein [Erythrobacter sp.]|jgi:cell wall-associated NlpC family hydrolase|nr:NlpC/P60 family protein [Erythrobacter sp.]